MDLVVGDDLDTSKPKDAKDDDHDQLDPDTQNGRLFEGYVYTSTSKTLGLDLTGLNAHFADIGDGTFDVYVYVYVYLDADLIIGGNDADLIYGQHGSDAYRFVGLGLGSDRLVESDGVNGPNDAADTLDYSGFGDGIEIDLNKYGEQSVNKATVNGAVNSVVTLFAKDAFEDVIGTAFADQIDGNQRNNRLVGGASDDEIDADLSTRTPATQVRPTTVLPGIG